MKVLETSGETFCESAGITDCGIIYFCWYRGGFIWRYLHFCIILVTSWFTRPSPHHRLSTQGSLPTFDVLQVSLASFLGVFMIFGLGFTSFFRMHELWRRSRGEPWRLFFGWMIHPGRLTAGTYNHHPFFERKMIWTTPLWLCSMLIFQGVVMSHDLSFNEGIIWDSDSHWIHWFSCMRANVHLNVKGKLLLATCNQL